MGLKGLIGLSYSTTNAAPGLPAALAPLLGGVAPVTIDSPKPPLLAEPEDVSDEESSRSSCDVRDPARRARGGLPVC